MFLAGDLNSRTGSKPDFIQFDRNLRDNDVHRRLESREIIHPIGLAKICLTFVKLRTSA